MRQHFSGVLTAMAAVLALAAAPAYCEPSGSWRITFDSQADADGIIALRVAPQEGEAIDVEVRIPARSTENRVADLVSSALKKALGSKNFRVGVDDGESVIVKKRGKTRNFELTILSPPIDGLGVRIQG